MTIESGLPPIHPGMFLKELLDELGLSQSRFAHSIGISPMRICHVVNGNRPVNAELAVLFGRAFEQTPQYWMNLQSSYDLKLAQQSLAERIISVHPLVNRRTEKNA